MPVAGLKKQCGARTRQGVPCPNPAMPNGRCRFHGGKALSGVQSPQWRSGKYSKNLPDRLAQDYDQRREDQNRLLLHDELALIDTRIGELLEGTEYGVSGELWKACQEAFIVVQNTQGEPVAHEKAIDALGVLIANGMHDSFTWSEIRKNIDQRRKLVDTEVKRVVARHKIITQEQGLALVGKIKAIVLSYVTDDDTRRAIAGDLRKLANAK